MPALLDMCASRSCEGKVLCVGVRKEEQRGHGKEGRQEGGRKGWKKRRLLSI